MLKTQQNELLRLIVDAKLRPTDFEWSGRDMLSYVGPGATPHDFYFDVRRPLDPQCHPSSHVPTIAHESAWDRTRHAFVPWLHAVKKEAEAPDLWAQVAQLRALVQTNAKQTDDLGDLPLVGAELDKLREAIGHVRALIEARGDLTDAKVSAMQESLNRIEQSGSKYSRKDITMLLLGSVAIPLVMGLVTPDDAQWLVIQLFNALMATHVLVTPLVHALTK